MKKRIISSLMAIAMTVSLGIGAAAVVAVNSDSTVSYAATAMTAELTGDHIINCSFETPGEVRLGDTVHLSTAVTGASGSVSYTFRIIPRNATSSNTTKTYTNTTGNLNWNPTVQGIYAVQVTATDAAGNSSMSSLYYMVKPDTQFSSFRTSNGATTVKVGQSLSFNASVYNYIGIPTYVYTFAHENTHVHAPEAYVVSGFSGSSYSWTPTVAGTYTVSATIIDQEPSSVTSTPLTIVVTE